MTDHLDRIRSSVKAPLPLNPPRNARDKVQSVEALIGIAARVRKEGGTVALAHGVFDLLHMGHVRYLEHARREGSVLMVTVTADKHVNKGPGRPVFGEQLRAEMVASLEYVDYVAINHAPTAEPVLTSVKPDVYVKGSDYKDATGDVTGKIVAEREAVESHGGRLVFADDITFSSSSLINKYLNIYDPTLQQYLDELRSGGALERMLEVVERIKDFRVLMIGDAIIDEYQYVVPMGKSPKENMIATLFQGREAFAGGVFAAANHVASFCAQVDVVTALGDQDSYETLIRGAVKPNVSLSLVMRNGVPTTRKCRFIDTNYSMRKMFEVYFMDDTSMSGDAKRQFEGLISERIRDYDAVVVTDFGHGLMDADSVRLLTERAPFLAVNTQSNSGNHGYNLVTKYQRADFICLDGPEARLAVQDKHCDIAVIAGERLPERIQCPRIVVTQGKNGCMTWDKESGIGRIPALTNTIVDTVGAGDAFFAVTAPMVAAGVPLRDVGFLGNAAGAIKVGILGHRASVERTPFIKFLTALLK